MIRRNSWPDPKSFPQTRRLLVSAVLVFLPVIHCARAGQGPATVTTFDPAFSPGLATLKLATGFIEDPPNQSPTDWKPNLQLLVGVKAVEGAKRTIYFVQLTTLPPPPTNSLGQPWEPILRTNHWAWSASNKTQFVTALYPVRARVFDETGRQLKEGQTPMAWGMLTNGLMDMCRLGFEAYHHLNQTNSPLTQPDDSLPSGRGKGRGEGQTSDEPKPQENEDLMRAMGGGFLWMIGMFSDLQTVPAVARVWEKAQCAIRWPSVWTLVTSLFTGFSISLEPRLKEVTLVQAATAGQQQSVNERVSEFTSGASLTDAPIQTSLTALAPLYRLPVDLKSDKRNLSHVEIIVGPAHGAEMLLAGIRSIHAKHPAKLKQEFLAQVLAAGTVREP